MSNIVDTISNTEPVLNKVEYVTKGTSSITVKAVGKDEEKQLLTYILYVQEEGGDWEKGAELREIAVGEGVELTANNLKEYTYYNWRVDVTDNIATTVIGTTQDKVRTFCSGAGAKCTKTKCSSCSNVGTISHHTVGDYYGGSGSSGTTSANCPWCGHYIYPFTISVWAWDCSCGATWISQPTTCPSCKKTFSYNMASGYHKMGAIPCSVCQNKCEHGFTLRRG